MINTMSYKSTYDDCLSHLQSLTKGMDMGALRGSVDLLHKIVTNILSQPLELKFRRIPKSSKSLQEKVLAHKPALMFLIAAGFEENSESVFLDSYD